MNGTETDTRDVLRRRELAFLVIVLLAAAALRTWRLDTIPPGLTHDEAGHGHDAIAILNGARPVYETVGYGREPLYDYWVAGLMAVAGRTQEVLRFSAVPLGLLTLVVTYIWTRTAFDTPVALASAALQSVAFWSLSIGRQALRSSLLPALFTGAVAFFWWATERAEDGPRRWHLLAFGVLVGATFYTYIPARGLWIIFPIFLVYMAFTNGAASRRLAPATLAALGFGLLLAVPLFVYLRAHPGAEQRLMMLSGPLEALAAGDPTVVLDRAGRFLAGFVIPGRGDDFLAYTIPGRPIFGPVMGALFVAGLVISVARWHDPASAFALIWFAVGIGPSLITGPAASTTRSIAALPVTFVFPALAAVSAARWAGRQWGETGTWLVGLAFVGLLVVTAVITASDYFSTWGESRDTRAAYQHTLTETASYLDAQPAGGVVAVSTEQPYAPHDPYVFELSLDRTNLSMRWFDARRALVLPPEPQVRLITPASASLGGVLAELPGFQLTERVEMRPDDLDPWFDVYAWEPRVTRTGLYRRIEDSHAGTSLDSAFSDGGAVVEQMAFPAVFGGGLHLLGYDVFTPTGSAGGEIGLLTVWEVRNPTSMQPADPADVGGEPVIFVHALDEEGNLVAQEDRLDAPAWAWQPGDGVAQVHRLSLPSESSGEPLALVVGVYRRGDGTRLPVSVEGEVVGDLLFLSAVDVTG